MTQVESVDLGVAAVKIEANGSEGIEQEWRIERDYAIRTRTLELAADPLGARRVLQNASSASVASLARLEVEWEYHSAPLLAAIRQVESASEQRKADSQAKMAHVRALRAELKSSVFELHERDEASLL